MYQSKVTDAAKETNNITHLVTHDSVDIQTASTGTIFSWTIDITNKIVVHSQGVSQLMSKCLNAEIIHVINLTAVT